MSTVEPSLSRVHEPLATLVLRPLHRGARVAIHDVRCRPHDFAPSREECSLTHQLVFPRRGVFEQEVRGEKILADANQVLFFNRLEPYRVAHPACAGDDCTVFSFDDELLREALALQDGRGAESLAGPFRFTHALASPEALIAHERVRSAAQATHAEALAIEEAALTLLAAALEGAYRQRAVSARAGARSAEAQRRKMQETALFLATHFREELTLEQIGRAVHCSPFHLARLFRAQAGLSLHQYRHRLRLREALRCIAEGESNLARLALALGFSSHSHLSDSFRGAFGTAPSRLRGALAGRLAQLSRNLEVSPRGEA